MKTVVVTLAPNGNDVLTLTNVVLLKITLSEDEEPYRKEIFDAVNEFAERLKEEIFANKEYQQTNNT